MSEPAESRITPLPIPRACSSVLVFGGTFDPPTRAHIVLAEAARDFAAHDALLVFVPAARSPHKDDAPCASDDARLAMLLAAIAGVRHACVWTDEIDRTPAGVPSFTFDTVSRALRVVRPGVSLRLLIGADQAASFHRWREARWLFEKAAPLVMPRAPYEEAEALVAALRGAGYWSEADIARWREAFVPVPILRTCATRVRNLLRRFGPDHPEVEESLTPAVLAEIRSRSLYATQS
ncbi:MAG: adenylyltransferase/cytidyltransferase family protein [Phycisphaeraceae bacterium]|nr:adenylyltransferase/cytidyltransferase family protein [Phycisphaeraceae bacterium]